MANRCGCGNSDKLPGYRVCAECKEARELYPHIFEGVLPDKLDALEDLIDAKTSGATLYARLAGNSTEVQS